MKDYVTNVVPTKTSELTNDSGFITSYTETDPTVPSWAKAASKPTYTAEEVGALAADTKIPAKASDLVDDSGHYTKPSGGIPASDMANGVIPAVDNTLTVIGAAADAKKTGDELYALKEETSTQISKFSSDITTMQNGLPGMISDEMDDKFGQEIGDNVSSWLTEHVNPAGSAVVVDDTLTIQGAAADAKKAGDEISSLKEDLGDLSDLETADKSTIVAAINEAAQSGGGSGGITVVDTVAEMVDTEAVYLYNGTETGYTDGHWYFYNTGTSAWTDGGQYTGWETVDTALENFLNENAQEMGTLTVVVGSTTYTYNGSANVSITLPVYNGGVS